LGFGNNELYDYHSGVSSLEQTRGTSLRLVPKGVAVNGVYHLKNDVAMKEVLVRHVGILYPTLPY